MWQIWLLSVIFQIHLSNCQDYSPIVTISDGKIIGIENKTVGENRTYYAYRGIPYAKPPIGRLRFKAPVPNDKWSDILYATTDKDECMQMLGFSDAGTESEITGSEDCLYINVYTTSLNSSLPVIVWFYGGSFLAGSGSSLIYGPDYLLEKEVIFVSLNYRVSIFGFLSTEDLAAPGNWGLKDQLLALKWVKKNIAKFGGDPDKVTIAGQSAGSASVMYLLQNPATKGLYRAAIMESGSSLSVWALCSNARQTAFHIGRALGIDNVSSYELIEELQKIDAKQLKVAQVNYTSSLNTDLRELAIGVVKEPKHFGSILTASSYELLQICGFNQVPMIIGFNSLEGVIEVAGKEYVRSILSSKNVSDIAHLAPIGLTNRKIYELAAGYLIRKYYFGLTKTPTDAQLYKYISYDVFVRSITKTVHFLAKCNDAGVYFYEFSHMGKLAVLNRTFDGVCHAEEIFYLFNTNFELVPREHIANPIDALTRARLVTLWTNFAKFLDPTPPAVPGLLRVFENVKWVPNTRSTFNEFGIKYLNINSTLEMQMNPLEDDWLFYQFIYGVYGDSDYSTY